MPTIAITSKRQATLPVDLCNALGVGPGDRLRLEPRSIDGESVWVIRAARPDWSWYGALSAYAMGASHDLADIHASVEAARARREP